MDVKQLPELTVRELVNYGRPLITTVEGIGHAPTMAEKIENDSEEGWNDWTEHRHQVAERREQCMEGMV